MEKKHYFLLNVISMHSFEVITDHHIRVIDQGEDKITHDQVENFYQTHLADLLIFRHAVLNKQYDSQCKLSQKYLTSLRKGDRVGIGVSNGNGQGDGAVVFNDGKIINVQSSFYDEKVKLNNTESKSFSTTDGFSEWATRGGEDEEACLYYIKTPDIHPVKDTKGLLYPEVRDEIKKLYKQVRDTKTSYALVNALKYGYLKRP